MNVKQKKAAIVWVKEAATVSWLCIGVRALLLGGRATSPPSSHVYIGLFWSLSVRYSDKMGKKEK